MSFYTDASLIMYPSGYKEDKIYSLKPTDGSGDLTFTRASTATRVNAEGLIETSPVNLLSYSEQFDNAAWTKNNSIVTANSIAAPNGTITADLITSNGISETGIFVITSFTGTNTWSVYAKKGTGRYLVLNTNTPLIATKFDLQDGVIVGTPSVGATPSIESVGNGWYRCIITSSIAENRFTVFITNNTTTDDFTSSIGLSYYLWGAQVNIGATAKPYFPTTDRLNVPRIDYTGGGCGSLLLEKQSTNLATYSSEFNNASWTKTNVTISANSTTSPDGTTNADKIVADSGSSIKLAYQVLSSTNGVAHSAFAFYKADEYSYAFLRIGGQSPSPYVIYDLTSQSIVSTANATSTSIENYGNGWYRVSMTYTTNSTTNAPNVSFLPTSGYTLDSLNQPVYNGDGVSGGYIYGAQLEQSTYPTSYIPCPSSSSVTRLADTASKTGISSLINSTEGVLYAEIAAFNDQTLNNWISISEDANINNNQFNLRYVAANNLIQVVSRAAGLGQDVVLNYTLTDKTALNKIAIKYKVNDWALWVNGVEVDTETSSTAFTANSLDVLDFNRGNDSNYFFGNIQSLMVFPSALSDTELATLTTL